MLCPESVHDGISPDVKGAFFLLYAIVNNQYILSPIPLVLGEAGMSSRACAHGGGTRGVDTATE